MFKKLVLLGIAMIFGVMVQAQKVFSEGSIKYDVFVDASSKPDGIYVISVKGGMLKRELVMNNGFNNITIYNQKTGKTLSLNVNEEQKYALEITEEELKDKNKRFENAILKETDKTAKIAGYACKGMEVTYVNQSPNELFYTPDLVPQNESFNAMFPGLQGIPLTYETKVSGNSKMKFVATTVEIKGMDSHQFNLPAGYKIVTKDELKNMK